MNATSLKFGDHMLSSTKKVKLEDPNIIEQPTKKNVISSPKNV